MEMEPKSAQYPTGTPNEPEQLEAASYSKRSQDLDNMGKLGAGKVGDYSELSEAAVHYIENQQRQNFYQASDQPYEPSVPASKHEEMGAMSLDLSKERDPTTMAPPQNQVTPSRLQLEPEGVPDMDQILQEPMDQMDLTPPPVVHMDNRSPHAEEIPQEPMPQHFDLQETKRKLKEIFIFYASFGDRLNTTHLKSHKFHKMLQDAKLLTNADQSWSADPRALRGGNPAKRQDSSLMNKKRIDLIFCQVNSHKSNMPFDKFLQCLIKLAEFKYPNYHPSESLKAIISAYFLPLYDRLSQSDKLGRGHHGGILDIKFDELVSLVFRDVGPILLEIYQVYFSHEVKGNQGGMPEDTFWKLNEKSLFEFLRDYDICPSLLSKSAAYQVFYHAKNAKEQTYHSTALDILTIASQKQRPGTE